MSHNVSAINAVLAELQHNFEVTVSDASYFVGLEIIQNEEFIFIHQIIYVKRVFNKYNLNDANPVYVPTRWFKQKPSH